MKMITWLLLTIQFRSFKAYSKYIEEQKRRKNEFEPPFEGTWVFLLQKMLWTRKHKRDTSMTPDSISRICGKLTEDIQRQASKTKTFEISTNGHKLRLAGQTIVIDEMWAVNPSQAGGIYVHLKVEDNWEIVYRTYWLMRDIRFIGVLSLFDSVNSPPMLASKFFGGDLDKKNPVKPALNTFVHGSLK
jgi:hypothetical protein